MRKFLLFLSVLFVGLLYAKADTTTITFSELGYVDKDDVTTVDTKDSNVIVVCAKGTGQNQPKYYDIGTGLRMYNGNTMTISVPDGFVIKEIIFTAAGSSYLVKGNPKDEAGAENGKLTTSGSTSTWTGESAKIVLNSTATCRCQKMEVTYEYTAQAAVDPVEISYELDGYDAVVTLSCPTDGATIYYGYSEDAINIEYTEPFKVAERGTIYANAKKGDDTSINKKEYIDLPYATFKEVLEAPDGSNITIIGNFEVLYTDGKDNVILTDGVTNILTYRPGDLEKFTEGTKISYIEAHVTSHLSLFELTNAWFTEGGEGAKYEKKEKTSLTDLSIADDVCDFILLKGCMISEYDANTRKATISLGEETVELYNVFKIEIENGDNFDITGFVWRANNTLQIAPTLVEGGVVLETVKTPVITPNDDELKVGDLVTISCNTPNVKIYYTLDGSEPNEDSTLYENPFEFEESCTVNARAYYVGEDKEMIPSTVASKSYRLFDPTCNIIKATDHDPASGSGYADAKHSCVVDGVDYHMVALHDSSKGIQMNNKSNFCYVIQAGENEGYVVESIALDYNSPSNTVKFTVRGSNAPFDDSDDNKDKNKEKIIGNGDELGTLSAQNSSLEFKGDYKYFAIYPTASGAVYLNSITIRYRHPAPLAAPALLGLEDLSEIDMYEFTGEETDVYFYDEDEDMTYVIAAQPLELDFDFDISATPDVEVRYLIMSDSPSPFALDEEEEDMLLVNGQVYDGEPILVESSCMFQYAAYNKQSGEKSAEKNYVITIQTPFVLPIVGLEDADVSGYNGMFMVESDKALSITFDVDPEVANITYTIKYDDEEEIGGTYDDTPIKLTKDCKMEINYYGPEGRFQFTYYFFITSEEPVVVKAPTIKEGNYKIDNGFMMSEEEVEIEFETVDGIHIYYSVGEGNAPAKAAAACENDHTGFTKHEGEIVKLSNTHKSFSFFACNPETGAHSETVTYQLDVATGILSIDADEADALYFNLQGVRIAKPENGAYIRVQKGKSVKVVK